MLLALRLLPALCVRHFVSSWGRSPGASEQRTGALVSDARTRQYAGRSIVPRLLLQHRDIVPRGMAELSHMPCFEKPQATFPGL